MNQQALSSLIWSVADLLRGDFMQSEYGRVILAVLLGAGKLSEGLRARAAGPGGGANP